MIYSLHEDIIAAVSYKQLIAAKDGQHLCIFTFDELLAASHDLGINEKIVNEYLSGSASKFESHEGFDFLTLSIPDELDARHISQRVGLYFTSSLLIFVGDDNQEIAVIINEIQAGEMKNISLGKIMHLYFDRLTFDDSLVLKKIEQEISDLEEALIVSKKNDFVFLAAFRKKLLSLKLYYEQLLEIFEAIEQNENELINPKELRYFRILAGRANRLYNGVLNLRDYVTQVREAYQTQIDINLNSVMKVFTVITSVFFPLTLIVGWYGMNLRMPEFAWRFGYLFVIAISIFTAAATLLYFKKKRWF